MCSVQVSLSSTVLKLLGKVLLAAEFAAEKEPLSAYLPFLTTAITGLIQVVLIVVISCRDARREGRTVSLL